MAEDTALEVKTGEMLPEIITPASAPMKLEQMSQMIGYMETFIQDLLKPDVDFGIIPGTQKPSLFKAGAEKLCMAFGLSEKYEIIASERDPFKEWEYGTGEFTHKAKKVRGYYYYSVRCNLIHKGTGVVWASQIGDCESTERGRETAPSNTILKMAQKRAFVGATLHATFTSDRFTADMDTYAQPASKKQPNGTGSGQPKSKPESTSADNSGFRMPFGKHKGELIAEIPEGYLRWCLDNMENLHDETRKAIKAELDKPAEPEPDPHPDDKTRPEPSDPTRESLLKEIPELERACAIKNDQFKPLEARETFVGARDLTEATDEKLIKYWASLNEKIEATKTAKAEGR